MRKVLGVLLLVCFSATALAFSGGAVESTGSVYRVIDGDTFIINLDDKKAFHALTKQAEGNNQRLDYLDSRYQSIRVRLANIDTAESVHTESSRNTASGAAISKAVKAKIEKTDVLVRCFDWGKYGRLICNVGMNGSPHIDNDLGAFLIKNWHSAYVTRWGKSPYFHREYRSYSR